MKTRRHHNNKGSRQIKRGRTVDQVKRIARKLGVPFVGGAPFVCPDCGAVSHHPKDVENAYCGRCHEFKPTGHAS